MSSARPALPGADRGLAQRESRVLLGREVVVSQQNGRCHADQRVAIPGDLRLVDAGTVADGDPHRAKVRSYPRFARGA